VCILKGFVVFIFKFRELHEKHAGAIQNSGVNSTFAQGTRTSTKINCQCIFKELIVIYSENFTKIINTCCWRIAEGMNDEACVTYTSSYHCSLKEG
jgi:hypothetical protein